MRKWNSKTLLHYKTDPGRMVHNVQGYFSDFQDSTKKFVFIPLFIKKYISFVSNYSKFLIREG